MDVKVVDSKLLIIKGKKPRDQKSAPMNQDFARSIDFDRVSKSRPKRTENGRATTPNCTRETW